MKSLIVTFLICFASVQAYAASRNETWQRCGVVQNRKPQRVFADVDGKGQWKEYRTLREVPELANDSGEYAGFLTGSNGDSLIVTEEPGEDFTAYTDYCFDKKGRLTQLRFELRTAWGWGYRQEGPIVNGKASSQSSEFFSTKTNESVPRPGGADDTPEALNPHLYLRESELPFFKLLLAERSSSL